jgi:hypothetical protein
MTDTALLLQNPVLPALKLVAHRGVLSRNVAELGMAQRALVLVEVVLTAPETLWIFEFWVAEETAIFITVMLRTPQASGIPQTRVADKAGGNRKIVVCATCSLLILVSVTIDMFLQGKLGRQVSTTTADRENEDNEGRWGSLDQLNPGHRFPPRIVRVSVRESEGARTAGVRTEENTEYIEVS